MGNTPLSLSLSDPLGLMIDFVIKVNLTIKNRTMKNGKVKINNQWREFYWLNQYVDHLVDKYGTENHDLTATQIEEAVKHSIAKRKIKNTYYVYTEYNGTFYFGVIIVKGDYCYIKTMYHPQHKLNQMADKFEQHKEVHKEGKRRSKHKSIDGDSIGDDDIIRDPDMLFAMEGLGITTWTEFWESNDKGDLPIKLK